MAKDTIKVGLLINPYSKMDQLEKDVIDLLLADAEQIFKKHALTAEEVSTIWNAIETFYLYQMLEQEGSFYEMTKNLERKTITIDE